MILLLSFLLDYRSQEEIGGQGGRVTLRFVNRVHSEFSVNDSYHAGDSTSAVPPADANVRLVASFLTSVR